ncbi:MAG: prepilin peptidase, partial [Chloroflexi bacterium]|nr:prepilin peptidase [Chloroflexota bacterium]
MLVLSFALLGLVAGLALDAVIVRLAVPPDDDLNGAEEAAHTQTLAAESGSLVVTSVGTQWPRRLFVMAATAGLFAIAAVRYDEPAHLALVSVYICVFVACAGTDLLAYRVPNVITYPAIIGAIVVGALLPSANVWEVLAGGALTGIVLLLPALFTGGIGMGMGDVKLAAFVGLAIGFTLA